MRGMEMYFLYKGCFRLTNVLIIIPCVGCVRFLQILWIIHPQQQPSCNLVFFYGKCTVKQYTHPPPPPRNHCANCWKINCLNGGRFSRPIHVCSLYTNLRPSLSSSFSLNPFILSFWVKCSHDESNVHCPGVIILRGTHCLGWDAAIKSQLFSLEPVTCTDL